MYTLAGDQTWASGYKTFSMLNSAEHEICSAYKKLDTITKLSSCTAELSMKFFLLINIKMPTIVSILIFISRKNFMLNWIEYDFFFIWVLRPFQEYFTYIEPIVNQRWGKTGVPGEKPPDLPVQNLASHMWPNWVWKKIYNLGPWTLRNYSPISQNTGFRADTSLPLRTFFSL